MPDETRKSSSQTLGSNAALPVLALILSYQGTGLSVIDRSVTTRETMASLSSSAVLIQQGLTADEVAAGEELCRLLGVQPNDLPDERFAELQALWR